MKSQQKKQTCIRINTRDYKIWHPHVNYYGLIQIIDCMLSNIIRLLMHDEKPCIIVTFYNKVNMKIIEVGSLKKIII